MEHSNEGATGDSRGETRRLIVNPTSGDGDHLESVRRFARSYGFPVVETERSGHAVELAERAAADGIDLLAVCGGDGTVHEAVEGLVAADALDAVTLSVVPAGTANIFASGLGIETLHDGFEVAERGEARRLDLGIAGGEPFVLSAIAGLPAKTSAAATSDLKGRVGTLAFVIEGIQEARAFDGLRVAIRATAGDDETAWSGDALSVLIGNLRRFTEPNGRANAEDGILDAVIVEEMPPTAAVTEAVEQRLLDQNTPHVAELEAERLEVVGLNDEPVSFSLDGEIRTYDSVRISVRPRALGVRVGDEYVPGPE